MTFAKRNAAERRALERGAAIKADYPTPTTDRDELVERGQALLGYLNDENEHAAYKFVSNAIARIQADAATIAGMEWQPIGTAPRDGTRILIAMPRDEAPVCEAWWAQDYENGPGYWSTPPSCTGRGYTILPTYPTHWMPLPNPPAIKGGDHG